MMVLLRQEERRSDWPVPLAYLASISPLAYIAIMNSKRRKTLAAVFKDPASGTIEWAAIESLLLAVGCEAVEGSGSRVRFRKDDEFEFFHRPHPEKRRNTTTCALPSHSSSPSH